MNKKTDYPDLEKSENVSFWKHLLNWFWNNPVGLLKNFMKNIFLPQKKNYKKQN